MPNLFCLAVILSMLRKKRRMRSRNMMTSSFQTRWPSGKQSYLETKMQINCTVTRILIHTAIIAINLFPHSIYFVCYTGQPHYNAIFGVHENRPCYRRLFTIDM